MSVPVDFGRRHAAHAHHDRAEQDCVAEREQRADLKRIRAGRGDHQHAEKADEQGGPARGAHPLVQEVDRGERGEDRRREHDRRHAGERHHGEGDRQHGLRGALRAGSDQVRADPPRAKDHEAGRRQDECAKEDQRNERAGEQHLADRVGRDQPFRRGIRAGEYRARPDHQHDRERNVLAARARRGRHPRLRISARAQCVSPGSNSGGLLARTSRPQAAQLRMPCAAFLHGGARR